jgi:hypothetical protein
MKRELQVTDSKNASVQPMQTPRRHGPMNRSLRVTERPSQLTDRDDPMLSLS